MRILYNIKKLKLLKNNNFLDLIKKSNLVLKHENEIELSSYYINFQRILFNKQKKFSSFFFDTLHFFYSVLSELTLFDKHISTKSVCLFSFSENQYYSIEQILKELKKEKINHSSLITNSIFKKNNNYKYSIPIKFNLKIILISFILFFSRGIPLYFKLKKKSEKKYLMYFNQICKAYIFVPYFLNLLQKSKPKLIIVSNDHVVNSRSLRISAEILNIKTLYIQHASVTNLFPPLEFDYALLDGNKSFNIYKECNNNIKKKNLLKFKLKNCQIFLTGQKKQILKKNKKNLNKKIIGLAINKLDSFNLVQDLVEKIIKLNYKCILRTHPSQDLIFINKIKNSNFYKKKMFTLSLGDREKISTYFMKIDLLISGNSSIHIEAALGGLPTFYYKLEEKVKKKDYYGFIEEGISKNVDKITHEMINKSLKDIENSTKRKQSIKKYSSTYSTIWEGYENQLTVNIVKKILNNQEFKKTFELRQQSTYKKIWQLKDK